MRRTISVNAPTKGVPIPKSGVPVTKTKPAYRDKGIPVPKAYLVGMKKPVEPMTEPTEKKRKR